MTSEPKRCHVCGRIYPCETCGGTGYRRDERQCYWDPCPDCEDGWREAEAVPCEDCTHCVCVADDFVGGHGLCPPRLGTDPDCICPKCRDEEDKPE